MAMLLYTAMQDDDATMQTGICEDGPATTFRTTLLKRGDGNPGGVTGRWGGAGWRLNSVAGMGRPAPIPWHHR